MRTPPTKTGATSLTQLATGVQSPAASVGLRSRKTCWRVWRSLRGPMKQRSRRRGSTGAQTRDHGEAEAKRLLRAGLLAARLRRGDLPQLRKSDWRKRAIGRGIAGTHCPADSTSDTRGKSQRVGSRSGAAPAPFNGLLLARGCFHGGLALRRGANRPNPRAAKCFLPGSRWVPAIPGPWPIPVCDSRGGAVSSPGGLTGSEF